MELKNLDTFIQVAELNSFTKAAAKLGYSQSTISFQIKQLEESLDIQLFERINHTIALTEMGKEVLRYAHQISKLARDMERNIRSKDDIHGHVRIAMADSLCNWLLKDNYVNFHQYYPHLFLQIIAAETDDMFRLLNQNEVDMVFTVDNHIYDKNYIIHSEEKIQTHFVASPQIFSDISHSIESLLQFPFILTEKRVSYRRLMDEKLASQSLYIEPILEIGNTALICSLVEQGMGLSFLPDYVTERSVASGKMIRLSVDGFDIDIWKQLLYHRDKWVTPEMQVVMNYLS